MINDVDATLKALLEHELPPNMVAEDQQPRVSISFAAPDDKFLTQVGLPAIGLFLYDVRENRDLRTVEWQVARQRDGSVIKQRPPARVDCSYLITAWAGDGAPDPAQQEHYFLGEVMKVLLRFPILPHALLRGELRQGRSDEQRIQPPTTALLPGRLQSLGEFWQALGGKPKTALNFTVTVSVSAYKAVEADKPVTSLEINTELPDDDDTPA